MRRTLATALVTLLAGATLVGCGGEDTPAVCGAVEDLKASVASVKDIDLRSSTAVSDLQAALKTIEGDIGDVKAEAKAEFSPQVSEVDTALEALKTTADAAMSDPSAVTIAAVAAAVGPLSDALQTLISDVKSTC